MAIVRWDPISLLRWPSTMFDDDDMGGLSAPVSHSNLDIYETQDKVVIKANVAGVKDEKVDITFEKGVLWIRAEEEEEKKEGRKYYQKATRSYSYKIAVPGNIDVKKEPLAQVENGVVTVTFDKAEEEKPRKIQVTRK